MKITDFADITYGVIEGTDFEDYIPSLCLPGKNKIKALQGIPKEEESNIREIALDWAINSADEAEEFLVAFREGPAHFRIIRRSDGAFEEGLFPAQKADPAGTDNSGAAPLRV